MKKIVQAWTGISLVQRIVAGLVIGALLGMFVPSEGGIAILGDVFVGALKAIVSIFLSYQFSVLRRKKPRRRHPYFLNSGSITLICLIMIILPAPYNHFSGLYTISDTVCDIFHKQPHLLPLALCCPCV